MTLFGTEQRAPGGVVDGDGRFTPGAATGGGKGLLTVAINTAASGATALVAAQAGKQIKVVSFFLISNVATTSVKFQDGATDLTGPMTFATNGGISVTGDPTSTIFQGSVNTAFNINLSAATQVSGAICYYVE